MSATPHTRVAVVGSGFAGIGMSMALARRGIDHVVFERATDVGGTWRDNTYPGCQCDVPSHLYSFSFAPNPDWSRTYSPQPEIWAYLRRVADENGVTARTRFGHEVLDLRWDDGECRWTVDTSEGTWTADAVMLGNGALSEPQIPDVPGLDTFEGTTFHSATWRHDHDLTGERVAVVGTGASAIQFVPEIQPVVESLHLFQRTPAWVLPHTDRPVRAWERTLYRRVPAAQRAVRGFVYWIREAMVIGMVKRTRLMKGVERVGRRHLEAQVPDPELRARLTPTFSPGCKRLLLSNRYYPALSKANVEVIASGVREVRPRSIVAADSTEREVDTIIFGTGFFVTNNPVMNRVKNGAGETLADVFESRGMVAYNGTTVAGFPNLFMLAGPNTGIGHTSLVYMIEAQIDYVIDALRQMDGRGIAAVDVRDDVVAAFDRELQSKMKTTVWTTGGCASWYLDRHGRNTTLWPDFTFRFRQRTRRFDLGAYRLRLRSEHDDATQDLAPLHLGERILDPVETDALADEAVEREPALQVQVDQ